MNSTDLYIQRLLESNPLRAPLLRAIIQSLQLPPGSRGLDAGCGIGLQCQLLLEAVGTDGHIVGLDVLPELLAYGTQMVEQAGLAGPIMFRQGDVSQLPFEDGQLRLGLERRLHWISCRRADAFLNELIRVVKPGGSIFILGWSSQQFLPGHPLLEARLNGTCSGYLPYLKDKRPEQNFMRALGTFRKSGLEEIKAQTFVADVCAPLNAEEKTALTSLLEMLWGTRQPEVSDEDWKEYQRLCSPGSPDFILNLPDYYGFFTYTLFSGQIPKNNK